MAIWTDKPDDLVPRIRGQAKARYDPNADPRRRGAFAPTPEPTPAEPPPSESENAGPAPTPAPPASPVAPNGQINPGFLGGPGPTMPGYTAPGRTAEQEALIQSLYGMVQDPGRDTARMKESAKQSALGMGGQVLTAARENAAARGVLPGGSQQAREDQINQATLGSLLDQYRAIENEQWNRQLASTAALDAALSGETDRAIANYNALIKPTIFGEGQREFDVTSLLALMNFLESQRQFDDTSGFNWWNSYMNQLRPGG